MEHSSASISTTSTITSKGKEGKSMSNLNIRHCLCVNTIPFKLKSFNPVFPSFRASLFLRVINNISANNMSYSHREGEYGDIIFAGGFKAYHVVDGDVIPNTFFIVGVPTQKFTVHYEEEP